MLRLGLLFFIFTLPFLSAFSQMGTEWDVEPIYNTNSKFWEDPEGLIYVSGSILTPDKVGDWVYFEVNEDGDRFNLFTRTVNCLETVLQDRGRHLNSGNFTIYPNPATENLNVSVPDTFSHVDVFTIDGKFVESRPIQSEQLLINVSKYNSGLYIIQCKNLDEKLSKLFVVE